MSYDDYKFQQPDDSYYAVQDQNKCAKCLDSFDDNDLFYTVAHPNHLTPKVCSFCLNQLHNPL